MQLAGRAITAPRALVLLLLAGSLAFAALAHGSVSQPPLLNAREALLVDANTGARLFALHPNREVAIASTTKLMTAYVTLEDEPLNRMLRERYYDATAGESLAGLAVGYRYSVADLLRAMLLPSGNDVAYSLALDVAGTIPDFVEQMNAAALKLGLTHTHFSTPIGLDTPDNYSSAVDLETLSFALMRDPFFAAVVRERSAYLPHGDEVDNTNDLLAYPFVVGIKTGHTQDAGYCLVGAASWHGVHLISVVLGDPTEADRDSDTLALLRYGLSLYHREPPS
jgi:D-alanyl-D-alanine carboxypeptidase (penicillin-binding protein 5/6)